VHDDYGYDTIVGIQNRLGSHDTQRRASMVENPTHRRDKGANLKSNPAYSVAPPASDEAKARLRQMVAFQFLMPGAPFIYYGDEVGMWGADDPDCRKPMLWPDLKYEAEVATPFPGRSRDRTPVEVAPDLERLKFYQQLCKLRAEHEVLRRGDFRFLPIKNESRLVAFERYSHDRKHSCVVFFNAGSGPVELPVDPIGERQPAGLSSGFADGVLGSSGFAIFID
ncbi:MAG: alpha-amylase family glycosyl hydrolase, partial [Verrucomicrobiales bacterium]